jgi:hypothetical protein
VLSDFFESIFPTLAFGAHPLKGCAAETKCLWRRVSEFRMCSRNAQSPVELYGEISAANLDVFGCKAKNFGCKLGYKGQKCGRVSEIRCELSAFFASAEFPVAEARPDSQSTGRSRPKRICTQRLVDVCFTPESGHKSDIVRCPLSAKSGNRGPFLRDSNCDSFVVSKGACRGGSP